MRLIELLLGGIETRLERCADSITSRVFRATVLNHILRALILIGTTGVLALIVALGRYLSVQVGMDAGISIAGSVAIGICIAGSLICTAMR